MSLKKKKSDIIQTEHNPQNFTWTRADGEREETKFELFNTDVIKEEVALILNEWLALQPAYKSMRDLNKITEEYPTAVKHHYSFWKTFLYPLEQRIANWEGLRLDFPQFQIDFNEIQGYDRYKAMFDNNIYYRCNKMSDYDALGIPFHVSIKNIDKMLFSLFTDANNNFKTPDELSTENVPQSVVDSIMQNCLNNRNYKHTKEEQFQIQHKDYKRKQGVWFNKIFANTRYSKNMVFQSFEHSILIGPTALYKLGAPINPLIAQSENNNPHMHPHILTKLYEMFKDWFDGKHYGDYKLEKPFMKNSNGGYVVAMLNEQQPEEEIIWNKKKRAVFPPDPEGRGEDTFDALVDNQIYTESGVQLIPDGDCSYEDWDLDEMSKDTLDFN